MPNRSLDSACDTTVCQTSPESRKHKICRIIWAGVGFVFFGLAVAGVVLPILPTTPFALVAAFAFAKSSEHINSWFKTTKIYKLVIEGYTKKRAMTLKAKLMLLIPITILMGISCIFMHSLPWMRYVLGVIWLAHIIYFGFIVKTDKESA